MVKWLLQQLNTRRKWHKLKKGGWILDYATKTYSIEKNLFNTFSKICISQYAKEDLLSD